MLNAHSVDVVHVCNRLLFMLNLCTDSSIMENRNDYYHIQANLAYSSPTPDGGPYPSMIGYPAESMETNLAYGSLSTHSESVVSSSAEFIESNAACGSATAGRSTKAATSNSFAKPNRKSRQSYRLSTHCLVSVAVFNVIVSVCALLLATSFVVLTLVPQTFNTQTVSVGSSEIAAIHQQVNCSIFKLK